jgi:hypothetical protein
MPQNIIMIAGIVGAGILILIGLFASAKERKTTEG